MAVMYQLDFLAPEKSEIELLRDHVHIVKESTDKVRKSLFARHGELARKYVELHDRLQILEQNICRGEVSLGSTVSTVSTVSMLTQS
jgi:hypothetical protein